jgi:hypothetical protein
MRTVRTYLAEQARRRRPRSDAGAGTLEYVGIVGVAALLVVAVGLALSSNAPGVGNKVSAIICNILSGFQGNCGGIVGPEREPTEPCVIGSDGDTIELGIGITFIDLGGNRGFIVEERSDGTFKVTRVQGGDVQATAGAGASTSFTIADNDFGGGASASISGGVVFQAGEEWIVDSQGAVDDLTTAENWSRVEDVLAAGNPFGSILKGARDLFNIGPQFPPPTTVYVAGGLTGEGSAYAGAGSATAQASGAASRMLGYSHDNRNGNNTFYFETTVEGSAAAEAAGIIDQVGANLDGEMKVKTSVTVDSDGNIVSVSRSALAAGSSAGLTNVLFGGDFSPVTSDQVASGTQWDATLPIRTDRDRQAALSLLASSGINPLGLGVDADPDGLNVDPLASDFLAAVRDRGDLTRYDVELDDTTWLAGSGEVAVGAKLGLNGSYSTSEMTASDHQYWDGTQFADRTNC